MVFGGTLSATKKGTGNCQELTAEADLKRGVEGGLSWWSSGKEFTFQCKGRGLDPWSGN